jgi:drug/metabolite transporter (DMT)-like permease
VPFIAVLLGSAFLAEAIRIEQILGGIVIVLGVAITRTDRITAFGGWLRTREPG